VIDMQLKKILQTLHAIITEGFITMFLSVVSGAPAQLRTETHTAAI
jgi:hypothetical protein